MASETGWELIYEVEVTMESDYSTEKSTGIERVRPLGELWVLAEGEGEMPGCGGQALTLMSLGYDPQKRCYVGTWIGSMMTHLWQYNGELDASETVLTLNSEGPAMSGAEEMAKYKDVIEFKSDNHRIMTSHVLNNGQWHHFMTAQYWRQPSSSTAPH